MILAPENQERSTFKCPFCQQFLCIDRDEEGYGAILWCGQPLDICSNIGANEAFHGRTEKVAAAVLYEKLGFGNGDYEPNQHLETAPETTQTAVEGKVSI